MYLKILFKIGNDFDIHLVCLKNIYNSKKTNYKVISMFSSHKLSILNNLSIRKINCHPPTTNIISPWH